MDRASRFIWTLNCGKRDKRLFKKAVGTLEAIINQTGDLTLMTDLPAAPVCNRQRQVENVGMATCYLKSAMT